MTQTQDTIPDIKTAPNITVQRARSKTIGTYSRSNSARKKKKKSQQKKRKKTKTPKTTTPKTIRSRRKFKERSIPRKLGPRDIGRNKYKEGTKLNNNNNNDNIDGSYGCFLDEKITFHSRNTSFLQRKTKNPVPKKETVKETGTPNSWKKPEFYKKEVQKMNEYNKLFQDKPLKPKDKRLEALKNKKIRKGIPIKQYGTPNAWKPIQYKYDNNGGSFLNEKYWFDSSHVEIDGGLSKLIEALPPDKKLKLNKMVTPTGYRSKILFIKKLREYVMMEIKRIHRDDMFLEKKLDEKYDDNDDDITYIDHDQFAKEIEMDLSKELNDGLDEVLIIEHEDKKQEKRESLHIGKKSTMTLDIDVDDAINGIMDSDDDDDGIDDDELFENKYKKLLRRKNSEMGLFQRKLLTMESINKLTDLIDDMEQQQISTQNL